MIIFVIMIKHKYSKRFKIDTDKEFKHVEFERSLGEFMAGFIECYPHLIKRYDISTLPGHEIWEFNFYLDIKEEE